MKDTAIEWADHTFNIAEGCMKVSPGCAHCYAETRAKRFAHKVWGPAATTPRNTRTAAYWREPLQWNALAAEQRGRARVFCSSLADVFEDHPTIDQERAKLWPLIRATPHLDWLLLTKRPERIFACLPEDWGQGYANVWLGTSVESQEYDARIVALLQVPAVLHFLSLEPLLGPVSLRGPWRDLLDGWDTEEGCCRRGGEYCGDHGCTGSEPQQVPTRAIGWVIVGGESGPHARPMDEAWVRALRDECAATNTPFLLKQLGGHPDKRGHEKALLDGVRHLAWPEPKVTP
jgi:protein gp37